MESNDDEEDSYSSTTWIVAGRDLNQGDAISQPDVFVPFRIHNRHTSWPLWRRHHYFWPLQSSDDDDDDPRQRADDKDLLVFAPGLGSHLSCHDRLHNIQYTTAPSSASYNNTNNAFFLDNRMHHQNNKPYSTLTSEPLTAARMIARGDPLAIPCRDIDLVYSQARYSIDDVHDFHYYRYKTTEMKNPKEVIDQKDGVVAEEEEEEEGFCLEPRLVVGESTIPSDVGKGAFSTRHYTVGSAVMYAPMIHMHRHELLSLSSSSSSSRNDNISTTHDDDDDDDTKNAYELLLNYAYGHPDSSLLLLPYAPMVNYINHASSSSSSSSSEQQDHQPAPNVALTWHLGFRGPRGAELFFGHGRVDKMLQRNEEIVLQVEFRAIRDIVPGDEVLMDYGDAWQQAWDSQVETCRTTTTTTSKVGLRKDDVATDDNSDDDDQNDGDFIMETCMARFRHEIGVPAEFFPQPWLDLQKQKWAQEKKAITAPAMRKQWDLPPLQPGEVRRLQVIGGDAKVEEETGTKQSSAKPGTQVINNGGTSSPKEPAAHVYRVGLPPQLASKMLDFADKMGLVDILYDYVKDGGNPMEKEATERHFINGGTWWAKRFDSDWSSNMHYITPDDDKSNHDMLAALRDAGWVDDFLAPLGRHFGLQGLMSYYMSFIAVTHCTGSYLHWDAEPEEGDSHFNCIFPLIQVPSNSTTTQQPELLLAGDAPDPRDYYSSKLILPYNYEPEAAICLGGGGLHSTGPIDYRGMPAYAADGDKNGADGGLVLPQNWRLGLTIYIVDVNNVTMRNFHEDWQDPPYPYHYENFTREEFFWKNAGRDWKAVE
jgi:hypothetical protein